MKKFLTLLLIFGVLSCICFPVGAVNASQNTITYFADGSYIITEITENECISTRATNQTKSGTKSSKYYNSDNEVVWVVNLNATFSYNGSTATCTSANTTCTIYDDVWRVTDSSASKSGNTATGNFTIKKYTLGIPVRTENRTITLTCSKNGVLS